MQPLRSSADWPCTWLCVVTVFLQLGMVTRVHKARLRCNHTERHYKQSSKAVNKNIGTPQSRVVMSPGPYRAQQTIKACIKEPGLDLARELCNIFLQVLIVTLLRSNASCISSTACLCAVLLHTPTLYCMSLLMQICGEPHSLCDILKASRATVTTPTSCTRK